MRKLIAFAASVVLVTAVGVQAHEGHAHKMMGTVKAVHTDMNHVELTAAPGKTAGFYVNATQAPWASHYHMRDYVEKELPALIAAEFPADMARQGIAGHSMGGHGALTISLRNPGRFRSTSAFAPIVSPLSCPWGDKALGGYLGSNRESWAEYDACALIDQGARLPDLLVDQGEADNFLAEQLKTHLLVEACARAGMPATIRMQPGYDHSYYFISSFMADHVAWHAKRLTA